MIGKILAAIAGKKAAEQTSSISGTGGAVLGVAAETLVRRLSPVGLVAAVAGGYALKRYLARRERRGDIRAATEMA